MMKKLQTGLLLVLLTTCALLEIGCSGNSSRAILPNGELTEEQKAAVKAEDKLIEDEESQGKLNKPKSKK